MHVKVQHLHKSSATSAWMDMKQIHSLQMNEIGEQKILLILQAAKNIEISGHIGMGNGKKQPSHLLSQPFPSPLHLQLSTEAG